jgi:CheY-like chemotaxis protein
VSPSILLVEDDAPSRELATELLEGAGYTVIPVTTAEAALESARAERPDLIVMDIGLPGMDGLAAARVLRGDPATRAIALLALTALAMPGDEARARRAGFDDYLTKPVDARVLLNTVRRLLATGGTP